MGERGGRMATCGILGGLLTDVFSLPRGRIFRLQDGYDGWRHYLRRTPSLAAKENLAIALVAKQRADAKVHTAKAEKAVIEDAITHLVAVQQGVWDGNYEAL